MSTQSVLLLLTYFLLRITARCEQPDLNGHSLASENKQEVAGNNTSSSDRQEKFLSLFTIVRFNNDQCVGSGNYSGTCLTSAECTTSQGTPSGTCASGFGVCCIFTFSACGSVSSRNCTYLTTPALSSSGQSCMYMINKCSSDICQMRIDFLSFQIAQPNKVVNGTDTSRPTATNCVQEQFYVTNAAVAYAPICGFNTGQHMYADVSNTNFIKLNFALSSANAAPNPANPSRYWNIKVTQIPCSSYNRLAPPGCLQYFTELSGTFTSYNYDTTTPKNSHHLASQDYSICFRMEPNYCTICYTVCDTVNNLPSQFDLSAGGTAGDKMAMSGAGATSCFADYIIIPDAFNQANAPTFIKANNMAADRLCGQFFNAMADSMGKTHTTVCSASKPFRFYVKTNTEEIETNGEDKTGGGFAGFCLRYNQSPCSGSG